MALIVSLNQRLVSAQAGAVSSPNNSYWDPVTKTNLNRSNPTSADLTAFSSSQLANISNAVAFGTLTLVSGVLPAATQAFSMYGSQTLNAPTGTGVLAASGGAGLDYHYGITGVAASDALQNNH